MHHKKLPRPRTLWKKLPWAAEEKRFVTTAVDHQPCICLSDLPCLNVEFSSLFEDQDICLSPVFRNLTCSSRILKGYTRSPEFRALGCTASGPGDQNLFTLVRCSCNVSLTYPRQKPFPALFLLFAWCWASLSDGNMMETKDVLNSSVTFWHPLALPFSIQQVYHFLVLPSAPSVLFFTSLASLSSFCYPSWSSPYKH